MALKKGRICFVLAAIMLVTGALCCGAAAASSYAVTPKKAVSYGSSYDGTVAVSLSAAAGETVAVTVSPDPGSALSSIAATRDDTGAVVPMTSQDAGTFTFVMPAANVTVTAAFGPPAGVSVTPYPSYVIVTPGVTYAPGTTGVGQGSELPEPTEAVSPAPEATPQPTPKRDQLPEVTPRPVYVILTDLQLASPPARTAYREGERFDPAGMELTAAYLNGGSAAVTDWTYAPGGALTAEDTQIIVRYTEGVVSKTLAVDITVEPDPAGAAAADGADQHFWARADGSRASRQTDPTWLWRAVLLLAVLAALGGAGYGAVRLVRRRPRVYQGGKRKR